MKTETVLLGFTEAAEALNVNESWLRRAVTANEVPHRRLGRKVRFTEDDIAQIVAQAARAGKSEVGALRTSKVTR